METYTFKKNPPCSAKMLSSVLRADGCSRNHFAFKNVSKRERGEQSKPLLVLVLSRASSKNGTGSFYIYCWLRNAENYHTCLPYSEIHRAAPTLAVGHQVHTGWQMPSLSGSSSCSCKNISFKEHGDFGVRREGAQSSVLPDLQRALTPQVSHR